MSNHRDKKGYAHFDKRTSLGDWKTRAKVLDPSWVARHSFWPLIHSDMPRGKFGTMAGSEDPMFKKKTRSIRYCSHIDRCVYQRYAFLINEAYDLRVANTAIDNCSIAYRANKGLNNISFAKEAFDFIRCQKACIIVVSDFSDFFEGVDHAYLKESLCALLGCEELPPDYYAVYKNATRYSCWEWRDLLKLNGLSTDRAARSKMNGLEVVLPYEVFKQHVKVKAIRNDSGIGIPQGSPLSAVLSNVYLLELDGRLSTLVGEFGGMYRRYCDDLLIVLPVSEGGIDLAMERVGEMFKQIDAYPGANLQQEKTACYLLDRLGGSPCLYEVDDRGEVGTEPKELDYLGFSFDGLHARVRAKTVGRYYYRMRRKARNALRKGASMTRLYANYSEKSWEIDGRGSFVDYARRASRTMNLEDPITTSIAKHSMEKIAKTINRLRVDSGSRDHNR